MPDSLTDIRDRALEAFDETWSAEHDRPRASFEGVRQTYWEAAFAAAMDAVVAGRSDLDGLQSERDALEDHVNVEGGCQRAMFLGNCADCDQYHRLDDRVRALEAVAV